MRQTELLCEVELNSCSIRMMTTNDASDFFLLVSDAEVKKQVDAFKEIDDLSGALSLIEIFKLANDKRLGAMWGQFEKVGGCFMGIIGVLDLWNVPSIFYALLPDYRHKGIMTECVAWLTEYLYKEWGKQIVITEVHDDNSFSKRVLQRCGYEFDNMMNLYCHKCNNNENGKTI